MPQYIVGWDIGGAHIKAAVLNAKVEVIDVFSGAMPLMERS